MVRHPVEGTAPRSVEPKVCAPDLGLSHFPPRGILIQMSLHVLDPALGSRALRGCPGSGRQSALIGAFLPTPSLWHWRRAEAISTFCR